MITFINVHGWHYSLGILKGQNDIINTPHTVIKGDLLEWLTDSGVSVVQQWLSPNGTINNLVGVQPTTLDDSAVPN